MRKTLTFDSLVRAFRWHRRWFAAVLAALAVLAGLNVLNAKTSGTVPVVAAARLIAGGTTITAADLTIIRLPEAVLPEGHFDSTEALIGQEVVAAVPPRGVLSGVDLLSQGAGAAPGKLALPIRFGDSGTVAMLSVGSRIDVLGAAGEKYAVVAAGVRVVAVTTGGQSGMLAASGDGLVMVEVDQSQATAISAAATAGGLSYALR